MPPGERHKAVHDQEGDKGDRAAGWGSCLTAPRIARREGHRRPTNDRQVNQSEHTGLAILTV